MRRFVDDAKIERNFCCFYWIFPNVCRKPFKDFWRRFFFSLFSKKVAHITQVFMRVSESEPLLCAINLSIRKLKGKREWKTFAVFVMERLAGAVDISHFTHTREKRAQQESSQQAMIASSKWLRQLKTTGSEYRERHFLRRKKKKGKRKKVFQF